MHQLTRAERSKGGSRTKFNNLKHGKYSKKLSQTYICPKCNHTFSIGTIKKQDAMFLQLASKPDILAAIKRNLVQLQQISDSEENANRKHRLTRQTNKQFIRVWEKLEDVDQRSEGDLTIKDLIDKFIESEEE